MTYLQNYRAFSFVMMTVLFMACNMVLAQQTTASPSKPSYTTEDYFGVYKGNLRIVSNNEPSSVAMEFHLLPTEIKEHYQYTIVYIVNEKRHERNYILKRIDAENGLYILDENNGIALHATAYDNKLYFMYEVQDNVLTTQLTFEGDKMIFEITSSNKAKAVKTVTSDKEETIEVLSYPIATLQKAILHKQ